MLRHMRLISVFAIAACLSLLAACGAEAPTNAGTGGTAGPTIALPTVETTLEVPTAEATIEIPTTEATTGLDSTLTPLTPAAGAATVGTATGMTETPAMASTMTVTDTMMAATPDAAATSELGTPTTGTSTTGTATTGTATTGSDMTSGTDLSLSADGTQLAFSETSLSAPAGETISVTFHNNSDAMQHNWVLVRGGDDVAEQVDQAALQNAPDYTPAGDSTDVIAATKMLNAGESETVTFTIDEPGTYTFLCTFPGHYQAGMKGTLTVQ